MIASRIEAAQREKAQAERLLATAPPAPLPLSFDEVLETLSQLRDLPELLGTIEQADRAALYKALGLTITYRRVADREEVKLKATFQGVDLERVGGLIAPLRTHTHGPGFSLWLTRRWVDLGRTPTVTCRRLPASIWSWWTIGA